MLSLSKISICPRKRFTGGEKRTFFHKKAYQCRRGRTLENFNQYLEDHPSISAVEINTVKSARGCKETLLTFMFRNANFTVFSDPTVAVTPDWDSLTFHAPDGSAVFGFAFATVHDIGQGIPGVTILPTDGGFIGGAALTVLPCHLSLRFIKCLSVADGWMVIADVVHECLPVFFFRALEMQSMVTAFWVMASLHSIFHYEECCLYRA